MDYLDPRKQLQHRIVMLVGYVLVAAAITITTLILLNQAYGYGIGKNGTVIQSGFVYVSSQPHPAQIYINGVPSKSRTDTRLYLPAGVYQLKLTRPGYHNWQRTIEVAGGDVQHFDYPLLIPSKLTTTNLHTYTTAPSLVTQSPDRRWLIVGQAGSLTSFDVYDLKNPSSLNPVAITLPANLLSTATGSQSLTVSEWADDNQHVLLQHNFDGKTEYILLDRVNPDQSLNLNKTLATTPSQLTLINKKYDQYYLYDAASQTLSSASLQAPTVTPILQAVLAYQSYGSSTLLYATSSGATNGHVLVKLFDGSQTYTIHSFVAGTTYLLNLTTYGGTPYVVAGATSENKVYIYKDPVGQLAAQPNQAVVPTQVLHVTQPNYLSFSDNAQFIVAENGAQFGVYDIENQRGYNFTSSLPLDAPAAHATWMDGDRLTYVSGGKLDIFDYDDTNTQTLVPAASAYIPAFAPDYKYAYDLAPAATPGQFEVTQTALLTAADL